MSNQILKGKFGVFTHYLYSGGDWIEATNNLDIPRIAKDIARTGASRYCLTLMQGSRYMIAPNATYDEIAGFEPGVACAVRDIPLELGQELLKYDIDLYLYYTGDGPWKDDEINHKFGFFEPRENISRDFVEKWAAVLREYSVRYGDLVKGWWIDGCYDFFGYNDELLELYHDACKAGNPDCVVAFNSGVSDSEPKKNYKNEEYTCGEYNDFTVVPSEQFKDGAQVHILAPLGVPSPDAPAFSGEAGWCRPGLKRSPEYLADYIKKLSAVPCPLTIDIVMYPDGSFDEEQILGLAKVSELLG